jgi:hypothetical protein
LRNGNGGCSGQKRSGRGYLPEEFGFKREEAVFGIKTFFVVPEGMGREGARN